MMIEELSKPLLKALELANAASVTIKIAEASSSADPIELKRARSEIRMLRLLLDDIYASVKLLNTKESR